MASLSWSSPVRAVGSRLLAPIPNEIYHEIFDYSEHTLDISRVSRKRLLSCLALVCRFFCALALPRIFKSLEFSADAFEEDDDEDHRVPSNASFCRAVIKGQEPAISLARHVIECIISSWQTDSDDLSWVYTGFLGVYSRAIRRMPNIRKVVLNNTDIDKHLFKSVFKLKNLESLTLTSCNFGDYLTSSLLCKYSPLEIKSFTFWPPIQSPLYDALYIQILPYLVNVARLEYLRLYSWPITRRLLLDVEQNVLLHLDIVGGSSAALCSLLNKSPRLEILQVHKLDDAGIIKSDNTAENSDNTVLKASCRNLHTLKCPPTMVGLVPGRPLHTVAFTGIVRQGGVGLMGMADVTLLKKSAKEILELHIPLHLYLSVSIYEQFPNLQVLRISRRDTSYAVPNQDMPKTTAQFDEMVIKLVTLRPPAASITEFYIDFGFNTPYQVSPYCLRPHYNILGNYVNGSFPNARIIEFTKGVRWWKDSHGETWEPCSTLDRFSADDENLFGIQKSILEDHKGLRGTSLSHQLDWPHNPY